MKLKRILLVDDREVDNFINTMICEETGLVESIDTCLNGKQALEYLQTPINGEFPKPDIIFLDINMPLMNGWEFLEAYEKLDLEVHGGKIIIMLTTSLNPDDEQRACKYKYLNEFKSKPMTKDMFTEIVSSYYNNLQEDNIDSLDRISQ